MYNTIHQEGIKQKWQKKKKNQIHLKNQTFPIHWGLLVPTTGAITFRSFYLQWLGPTVFWEIYTVYCDMPKNYYTVGPTSMISVKNMNIWIHPSYPTLNSVERYCFHEEQPLILSKSFFKWVNMTTSRPQMNFKISFQNAWNIALKVIIGKPLENRKDLFC